MAGKTTSTFSSNVLERYQALVANETDIELKGASMPYTSINGNMFSFLSKDGRLHLRFSKNDLVSFIKMEQAEQSVQHGVVMKEYAVVPDIVFADFKKLSHYFNLSYRYAKTLKNKATTRKKS